MIPARALRGLLIVVLATVTCGLSSVSPAWAVSPSALELAERFCRTDDITEPSINPEIVDSVSTASPSGHVSGHLVAAIVDGPNLRRWLCVVGVLRVERAALWRYDGDARFSMAVGSAPPGTGSSNALPVGTRMLTRTLTTATASDFTANFEITGSETRSEMRERVTTVMVEPTRAEKRAGRRAFRTAITRANRTYEDSHHTRADRLRLRRAVRVATRRFERAMAPQPHEVTILVPVPVEKNPIRLSWTLQRLY